MPVKTHVKASFGLISLGFTSYRLVRELMSLTAKSKGLEDIVVDGVVKDSLGLRTVKESPVPLTDQFVVGAALNLFMTFASVNLRVTRW